MPSTVQMQLSTDCVCAPDSKSGVKPVHIVAKENIEIWGACQNKETPYSFGCNHRLVAEGESVTLPENPVQDYSGHGAHFHIRSRRNDPHGLSRRPWEEIKLSQCQCNSEEL